MSETTWHRCVVWGRLGEYAATLTKGAHVQIEGDIQRPGAKKPNLPLAHDPSAMDRKNPLRCYIPVSPYSERNNVASSGLPLGSALEITC